MRGDLVRARRGARGEPTPPGMQLDTPTEPLPCTAPPRRHGRTAPPRRHGRTGGGHPEGVRCRHDVMTKYRDARNLYCLPGGGRGGPGGPPPSLLRAGDFLVQGVRPLPGAPNPGGVPCTPGGRPSRAEKRILGRDVRLKCYTPIREVRHEMEHNHLEGIYCLFPLGSHCVHLFHCEEIRERDKYRERLARDHS
jgi:hypothetical protein